MMFFSKLSDTSRHCIFLSVFAFLLCVPALLVYFPDSQDGVFALMAFKSFSQQFYAGEWYPRWLFDFYNGFGAPMFYYYPPFLFYLEVLIDTLSLRALPDYLIIGLTASVLHISAALACYVWIRDISDRKKALIAALLYSILPNHLIFDLYYKGTLTQLSAYTWLPLILLFLGQSLHNRKAIVYAAVSYALLITSSVPMALAFTPFFLLYIAYAFYNSKSAPKHIIAPVLSLALGFGLAGFHIITAYLMTDYIHADEFWSDFYDPRNWFICTYECGHSPYPGMSFAISKVLWFQFFVIAALSAFCVKTARAKKDRADSLFWFVIAAGAMFMMSEASLWFWDNIPLLERIQFPWRLALALDLAFIAFIVKLFSLPRTSAKFLEIFALCMLCGFTVFSINTAYTFSQRGTLYDQQTFDDMVETRNYFGVYIPSFTDISKKALLIEDPAPLASSQGAQITNILKIPYGFSLDIKADNQTTVSIRQLYFPSWKAVSLITGGEFDLKADPETGRIIFDHPGGDDTIILSHTTLWQERAGLMASLVCVLLLMAIFGTAMRQKKCLTL